MLPFSFIERVKVEFPKNATQIIDAFQKPRIQAVRVNTIRIASEKFQKEAQLQGVKLEPVPWSPDIFIVKNRSVRVSDTKLYSDGLCTIQNVSSMLVSFILDPKPQEKVLDLCSAPGTKTSHIAELMKNSGEVTAVDTSRTRLEKLRSQMKRLGITNVSPLCTDGRQMWKQFPEYFDRVLVDAPCSMEGMFVADNSETYNHWSIKKTKELARLQKWLLRSAISSVKVGGLVVYATCTLGYEENENVISWILEKEKNKVECEAIKLHPLIPELPTTIPFCRRICPTEIFEGFFITRLRKISSTVPSSFTMPR